MSRSVRLRWWMRSAIAPILRPCVRAKSIRSGSRAMVPSAFMISHSTAAGVSPASSARSQHASVCPARASTPPGCAISGNTWPGCTMSDGFAPGAAATRIVCARSCAEMPVDTPCAASIETVKLVPCTERFCATIGARLRRSACAAVMGMQMSPRPCVAMKLIFSAVTKSAAKIRSPSFSRSSSSTSTAMRPALRSAIRSVIGAQGHDDVFRCDGTAILPSRAVRRYGPGFVGRRAAAGPVGRVRCFIDGRRTPRRGFR